MPFAGKIRIKRDVFLLGLGFVLSFACGCSLWSADRWQLDRFRDERAVDVEQKLSRTKPIVENPF
jgi:hypothetical protein